MLVSSLSILPKPFAWISISAGKVKVITREGWVKNYIPQGGSQIFDVSDFEIAKYPVDNIQNKEMRQGHAIG